MTTTYTRKRHLIHVIVCFIMIRSTVGRGSFNSVVLGFLPSPNIFPYNKLRTQHVTMKRIDITGKRRRNVSSIWVKNSALDEESEKDHVDKRTYLNNPAVTPTALAHSIWKSVIIPFQDTVIDATCGNGKDSVVLSDFLFNLDSVQPQKCQTMIPELLCIDIQQLACDRTFHNLSKHIQDPSLHQYIRILNTSHDPLPKPRHDASVGLVCYNLGYLPGVDDKLSFSTQTKSTISSITQAAMMLRIGGLLSIMIYPGSNFIEADAVERFCEGLARISSKEDGSWKDYVEQLSNQNDDLKDGTVTKLVGDAIQSVALTNLNQGWRVFQHKPLGRSSSPNLLTALRIK